jgi:transcriptional regulator of acetoin/glycerol metabolism
VLQTGISCNVTGREHFFAREASVSCLSAPIFNSSGQLIGLLDASSEVAARQHHTLALVNLAVQNVENRLFVDDHRGDHIIQFHPRQEYLQTQNVAMIAFNQDGQINGVNRRTGELLTGIKLSNAPRYEDVFKGQFQPVIDRICKGEVIQITDWLQAGYFARLRLTHATNNKLTATQVFLPADPIYLLAKTTDDIATGRIFKDEALRYNLRLGKKSAQQCLPVMLVGGPGTGKNTTAEEIHDQLNPQQSFLHVDCSTVNLDSVENQLIAQMKSNFEGRVLKDDKIDLNQGGTLYLDRVELLPIDLVPSLNTLLNRVLQRRSLLLGDCEWIVLSSTEASNGAKSLEGSLGQLFKRLAGFSHFLPKLKHRSDFRHMCCAMLGKISPQHTLSNNAVEGLKQISAIANLSNLDRSLRTLATQHHEGIIRSEGVRRILGHRQPDISACGRCAGQMAKEAQCLEIRKVIRECNGNVALAARQLGVARNTVYAHGID